MPHETQKALLVSYALFSESHEIVTAHRAFSRLSHLGGSLLTQRPISPALARGRTVTAVGWATAGLQAGHGARPGDLGRPEQQWRKGRIVGSPLGSQF